MLTRLILFCLLLSFPQILWAKSDFDFLSKEIFINPHRKSINNSKLEEKAIILLKIQNIVLKELYQVAQAKGKDETGPKVNDPGIGVGCELTSARESVSLQRSGFEHISDLINTLNQSKKSVQIKNYSKYLFSLFDKSLEKTKILTEYLNLKKSDKEKKKVIIKENPWIEELFQIVRDDQNTHSNKSNINKKMMLKLGTWPSKIPKEARSELMEEGLMKILTRTRVFGEGSNRNVSMKIDPSLLVIAPDKSTNPEAELTLSKRFARSYLDGLKGSASTFVRKKLFNIISDYKRDPHAKEVMKTGESTDLQLENFDQELINLTKFGAQFIEDLEIVNNPKMSSVYFSFYDIIRNGIPVTLRCFDNDTYSIEKETKHKLPFQVVTYAPQKFDPKKVENKSYKRSDYKLINNLLDLDEFAAMLPTYTINLRCNPPAGETRSIDQYLRETGLDFVDLVVLYTANYKIPTLGKSLAHNLNRKSKFPLVKFNEKESQINILSEKNLTLEKVAAVRFFNHQMTGLARLANEYGFIFDKNAHADVLHIQSLNFIDGAACDSKVACMTISRTDRENLDDVVRESSINDLHFGLSKNAKTITIEFTNPASVTQEISNIKWAIKTMPYQPETANLTFNQKLKDLESNGMYALRLETLIREFLEKLTEKELKHLSVKLPNYRADKFEEHLNALFPPQGNKAWSDLKSLEFDFFENKFKDTIFPLKQIPYYKIEDMMLNVRGTSLSKTTLKDSFNKMEKLKSLRIHECNFEDTINFLLSLEQTSSLEFLYISSRGRNLSPEKHKEIMKKLKEKFPNAKEILF